MAGGGGEGGGGGGGEERRREERRREERRREEGSVILTDIGYDLSQPHGHGSCRVPSINSSTQGGSWEGRMDGWRVVLGISIPLKWIWRCRQALILP